MVNKFFPGRTSEINSSTFLTIFIKRTLIETEQVLMLILATNSNSEPWVPLKTLGFPWP
jgi:hypothetical protein